MVATCLPYLAFVPLRPSLAGVPFQDLFHISYFSRLRYGGFMIDPQIILGWARLEKDIRDAVNLLLAHEHAPAIAWIVPTALVCQGVFKRAHILRAQFSHSKEWFSLFMGCPFLCNRCQYNSPSRKIRRANATLVLIPISVGLFADLAIRHKVINGGLL